MMGDFDGVAAALQETLTPLIEGEIQEYNVIIANAGKGAKNNSRNTAVVGSLAILLSALLAFFITRAVTLPIRKTTGQLNEGADQINNASEHIAMASQSLAEGTTEQAANLEEISASLEEMSSMTRNNADNATQADSKVKEANTKVAEANDSMEKLIGAMEGIYTASEETSKIIKTIDEIAFQTNLLALNAAVEAARAGDAGAGFAVVADEVRSLAMRAAEAARNTTGLIEDTVSKVQEGKDLLGKTNDAFAIVADSSEQVGTLIGEIATASNEQSQGIDQINTATSEMDKVVQQNAAGAEESASSSEQLSAQASVMKSSVEALIALLDGEKSIGSNKATPINFTQEKPEQREENRFLEFDPESVPNS